MNESLVADGLASETEWSGLLQNGSVFKAEHLPQYKNSITDDPAPRPESPLSHKDRLIPL